MLYRLSRITAPAMVLLLVFTAGCRCAGDGPADTAARSTQYRKGDVILQRMGGKLSTVIAEVSHSKYSHCGLVVEKDGGLCVIEAIPVAVRYTPIETYIEQGVGGYYTHIRFRGPDAEAFDKVEAEAEKFLGRPYDFQYRFDDKFIYCSELVYKAFKRGAGFEAGRVQKLGDLDWKGHETFIRSMALGALPLEREMVTPQSLVEGANVIIIKDTFPAEKKKPSDGTSRGG